MAISRVSAIGQGPQLLPPRISPLGALGKDSAPVRVEAIPALRGRAEGDAAGSGSKPRAGAGPIPAPDPRGPASLFAIPLAKAEKTLEVARILTQLKARDSHVRDHEAAHIAAGSGYVRGGASYSYQKGPDGRSYAVGGEVGIDTSPLPGKPEETAAKMVTVRAAAMAPSDPSAADLAVAAAASLAEAQARAEMNSSRAESLAQGYASSLSDLGQNLDLSA